jgi:anaerobic selenocysteine-containing dehydrogenase
MTESKTKIVRTTTWSAGPGCHGGCGVLAHIKDGKLVKLEGDPDHPWNHGRLCARALAMTQYVENPKRLRKPLLRAGERGEGKWREISWDEAYDFIEERMTKIRDEHGPESVVFSMGTGRDIGPWICMLAYAFGSPNVMFALSGNACYSPRIAALDTVQGDFSVFDAGQWLEKRYADPRYKAPECMIIWGYNIPATCPDNLFGHWIIDLMKKGTKIISVDPRLSFFASRAKHWLPVRPGTDAALAMGMLKVIIDEDLFELDWVLRWSNACHLLRQDNGKLLRESAIKPNGNPDNFVAWDQSSSQPVIWDAAAVAYSDPKAHPALSGEFEVALADGSWVGCRTVWDALRAELDNYAPDEVKKITGVPAGDMAAAARLYATSKPASIHWGVPIDMTPEITPLCQAIATMWAITGNLDVPGGNVFARSAFNAVAYALPGAEGVIKLKDKELDKPRIGAEQYGPFNRFIWRTQTDTTLDQIFSERPYPIKGLWIQTCNLLGGIGLDPKRWREALKKLDFIAAVDLFPNATTEYADIVLPAATFLEKDGVRSWWVPLQSINKALTVDDCKPDVVINFELSKRFDPDFKWDSIEELYDDIIKPSGMNYKELQKKVWAIPPEGHPSAPYRRHEKGLMRSDGKPGFNTPTGLFELYATLREGWDLKPLPYHKEPPFTPVSRPDLARDYPLILSTGRRSPVYFHSEHRQIPWLRSIDPDPLVEINPDTAAKAGIGDGEWVWVENWMGRARFKAKVTLIVPSWMVMATHAWWLPEKKGAEPDLYGTWEHNINLLLPMGEQGRDGLGAPIKHSLCKIYKCRPEEVTLG